jgi:hypothetical protein
VTCADHQHEPRDVGAAYERHDHDALDVSGVAREHHSHTVHDLPATPTLQQFRMLEGRVAELELRLETEEAVPAAVADGAATVERIATAIERRAAELAGWDKHSYLAEQLRELAAEIRNES